MAIPYTASVRRASALSDSTSALAVRPDDGNFVQLESHRLLNGRSRVGIAPGLTWVSLHLLVPQCAQRIYSYRAAGRYVVSD